MYLEADVLGGKRLMECKVINGDAGKETLISLNLLKKFNMIHSSYDTFSHESISEFLDRKHRNKGYQAYAPVFMKCKAGCMRRASV